MPTIMRGMPRFASLRIVLGAKKRKKESLKKGDPESLLERYMPDLADEQVIAKRRRRKRAFVAICIAAVLCVGAFFAVRYAIDAKRAEVKTLDGMVIRMAQITVVADGDSCEAILGDGTETKVRFIGVDTPEMGGDEFYDGLDAKRYTESVIKGRWVWLVTEEKGQYDKYGRLLAYVWLVDPTEVSDLSASVLTDTINGMLIVNGYAEPLRIRPNTTFADVFQKAYDQAHSQG